MNQHRVWHPLSSVGDGGENLNIVRGEGAYLYDDRGRAYLDGLCGLWNVSLGYGNRRIIDAATDQMTTLPYVNLCEFRSDPVSVLAERLLGCLHDGMAKIYFTCTGSESNELAIKIIRKYQALRGNAQKRTIGVLKSSYHGSYYGSLSASQFESSYRRGYGPFLDDFIKFSLPICDCCSPGQLSSACVQEGIARLEREFRESADTLGGFMLEPVLGSGGVLPLPEAFMQKLFELCEEYDVLLVCDEVATGFGRTGKMFAHEHSGIRPDIVCMSKGINSGYLPMGAAAFSRKIESVFEGNPDALFHLSTQNGNPVCCATALASLEQLTEHGGAVLEHVRAMSHRFEEDVNESIGDHPNVREIRVHGLMIAVDLVESKATGEQLAQSRLAKTVEILRKNGLLSEFCYNEGITSCITLFLPFVVTERDIQSAIGSLEKTLRKLV